MKTTLLIAALNEIEGSKVIMPRINREWVDEIILVDGGSTDGTIEFFEEMGIHVVNQKSKGICGAYWEGVEVATGDVIIPFSPDNNSIPELIPDLVKKMEEGYDMVIVSRYISGAKSEDDDFITAMGNWMFTKMVNILFGGNYTDSLVMFRAFKKELVSTLPMVDKTTPVHESSLPFRTKNSFIFQQQIPTPKQKESAALGK